MNAAAVVLLPVIGATVVLVTLADIFLTVLHPGSGRGPLRRPLSQGVWHAFRFVAVRLADDRRRRLLTYCGPVLVAVTIAVWPLLLILGWALIYRPALGTGLVAANGATAQTWPNAVYVSGFSLTTLGTGDVVPTTDTYRILIIVEAATGFSVVTMVITYFLSLYNAIAQRKTFAATLDHQSNRTGDSIEMVIRLAASSSQSLLTALTATGQAVEHMYQAHQSYPVLRWFHYREVRYALPRILFMALDTAALTSSALDLSHGADHEPMAVLVIDGAAQDLLRELVPLTAQQLAAASEEAAARTRFTAAVAAFQQAGLTARDDRFAIEKYLRLRRVWEHRLRMLTQSMLYDWTDIQPVPDREQRASRPAG